MLEEKAKELGRIIGQSSEYQAVKQQLTRTPLGFGMVQEYAGEAGPGDIDSGPLVLGMSISALSHQLRFLRERGVVARRKDGRIAYYNLVDEHVRRLVVDAVIHVSEGVA